MNIEDYVNAAALVIRRGFQPSDPNEVMTAAKAGFLVRRELGVSASACGFVGFKDVLQALETRGVITLATTAKGALGFRLTPQSSVTQQGEFGEASFTRLEVSARVAGLPRLRNQVWLAYVARRPAGHRFVNRSTGQVRRGLDAPPEPKEDWVEIVPLDPEAEKAAAKVFLERETGEGLLEEMLASEDWLRMFPAKLSQKDPVLAAKWNRDRTRRVVEKARELSREQNLDSSMLFEEQKSRVAAPASTPSTTTLRQSLLQAIARMSTSELIQLKIPAKYLVAVLRPDLLVEE